MFNCYHCGWFLRHWLWKEGYDRLSHTSLESNKQQPTGLPRWYYNRNHNGFCTADEEYHEQVILKRHSLFAILKRLHSLHDPYGFDLRAVKESLKTSHFSGKLQSSKCFQARKWKSTKILAPLFPSFYGVVLPCSFLFPASLIESI